MNVINSFMIHKQQSAFLFSAINFLSAVTLALHYIFYVGNFDWNI